VQHHGGTESETFECDVQSGRVSCVSPATMLNEDSPAICLVHGMPRHADGWREQLCQGHGLDDIARIPVAVDETAVGSGRGWSGRKRIALRWHVG
jgi:hypothetical protein